MKERFITWKPGLPTRRTIEQVRIILEEYEGQGYRLTLRQLYYQLVARDMIANKVTEYKRLGNIVSKARLAGMIDWYHIEDRVRIPQTRSHWENPAQILQSAASGYYKDRWEDQTVRVEVWCEKDAISNILIPVCRKYDVPYMSNRGYSSQSAMYEAYQRIDRAQRHRGQDSIIIYLGDHDPSGIDMTRDIEDRIGLFINHAQFAFDDVERIALNMDQVEQYNPPTNPAKITDSRFATYVQNFGHESWELDALEPRVLASLLTDEITKHIDKWAWAAVEDEERREKDRLYEIVEELKGE